jgi:hypothetical protein
MKNRIVRKSNVLVEASYKLSTQEQRIVLFLVSMLKPDDEDFKDYSLSIKEFSDLVGGNNKSHYKDIRGITKKLISRVFSIKTQEEELQISWLSSAQYISGQGIVILSFDRKLKPFLLQLKSRFTKFPLHLVMQLRSSFSIRFYELLKQYHKIGLRVFDVDDLRGKLGIEKDQYKNFSDFKRYVLLVAQEELAEKTDISFKFEEIKIGRGVGKLRFYITEKLQVSHQITDLELLSAIPIPQEAPESIEMKQLIALLPEEYRAMESILKMLRKWLKEKNFDYVSRNIEYANDGSNAVNPGANLTKGSNYRNYLAKSLKGDFGLAYQDDKALKTLARETAQKKAEEEARERRQKQEQERHEKEVAVRVQVYLKNMSPEGIEALKQEAIASMKPEHQVLVAKQSFASEMMIKVAMDNIVRARIKES